MYNAYVVEINDLHKHPNADKLQVAKVFGLNVIVGVDVQVGDIMIYFPSDGQLNKEFAEYCNLLRKKDANGNNIGGYMDERKRNIKAIKLRGEYSDGLLIPVHKLTEFVKIDESELTEGMSISTLNGILICEKYVPRRNVSKTTKVDANKRKKLSLKDKYPLFHEHIDTQQLAYYSNKIKAGDKLTVTLKAHGCSQRCQHSLVYEKPSLWNRIKSLFNPKRPNYQLVSGTRRTILENFDGGYYGSNEFRRPWHDFFDGKLQKGETVYFEVVGYADKDKLIMPPCNNKKIKDKDFVKQYGDTTEFTYGCENGQSDIYVYRMSMTNEDGFEVDYSTDFALLRCEQMGVKHVPVLFEHIVNEDEGYGGINHDELVSKLMSMAEGPDIIDPTHLREGVVVRVENRLEFTAYKHKSMDFKILEGIIKENATSPDMEEQEG